MANHDRISPETGEVREHVASVRARIAAMQLVTCRMAHERVLGVTDVVARQPLCSKDTRALRLACGHTTARDRMARDLMALHAAHVLSTDAYERFASDLAGIGHTIQVLDHRKGDAEKHHALLLHAHQPATEAAAQVRALEQAHDADVVRLRHWRDRLLRAIDDATDLRQETGPLA